MQTTTTKATAELIQVIEALRAILTPIATPITPQHPYWLPLPVSETTELYCRPCAERILAQRLATGQILWDYVCSTDPERDLIDLSPVSQFGVGNR